MEKITTDISTFENMRKAGYVYVDKTDLLWQLVAETEGRQFFISRPRRFGKSLMLSTLQAIFEGKRELFKGLKIEKMKYDWAKYPVVMLDMSDAAAESVEQLRENLLGIVDGLVDEFELEGVRRTSSPGMYLGNFFKALAKKSGPFVVLVDEYDVPLQGFFGNRSALICVRRMMHNFYIRLKRNQANIRFLMLTGVTKLTKVSVFSGLNHLRDLTMKFPDYATLLGYTPEEIAKFFPGRLDALAKKHQTNRKGALKLLLDWYDSYRFSPDTDARVCNPISIGLALSTGTLKSFWVGTAVATLV
ncbi:MAG: AAA family ATPase, partial [Kiritimatiellae bacterium]|nr:AAA family ATPase [Kiritimatiellia bacterium]